MKTTRHIGYCPVCDKNFKVRSRVLVHHGYQRPGFGHIVGDCLGALRTPHQTSPDLAAEYRDMLQGWLKQDVESLKFMPSLTRLPRIRRVGSGREKVWTKKCEAPEGGYDWDGDRGGSMELHDRVQKWDRAYAERAWDLKQSIEHLTSEVARVAQLWDSWVKKDLTTVDETVAAKRDAKAVRDGKKAADREAKIDKAVESYQKRIDSAVKHGNASTLQGIYESAQGKLLDLSGYTQGHGYGMTKSEAVTRLDRDNVWGAFGLLTADGPRAKAILSDMYGKRLDPTGLDGWPNRMAGKLADGEVAKWVVGEWVNSDWSGNRPTADIKVTAAFATKRAALMADDSPFKMETPAAVEVGELLTLVDHYLTKPQGIVRKKDNIERSAR